MSIVVDEKQFEMDLEGEEVFDELSQDEVTVEAVSEVDDLEEEISDLPDKFKGKTSEDIAKSYMELEKENGRRANEIGELRKLTDDILKQQLEAPAVVQESNIDLDDLLENPNDVIAKAVKDSNDPRIEALEKQLKEAKVAEQRGVFESKHSDWDDTLKSADFKDWVTGSAVRQDMFNKANLNYDYAVLDEVFSLYGQLRGASKEVAETKAATKRKKDLRNSSTEKGSTGEVTKKVYRRADLIRLHQENPARYSEMNDEIILAYQEGRVR